MSRCALAPLRLCVESYRITMELPVFHDNLRSSASWTAELEREGRTWQQTTTNADTRVRELQLEQAIERMGQQDAARLVEAADLVSTWALESEATLDIDRLVRLYRVLTGARDSENIFRSSEARKLSPYHDPAPAAILPRLLDNAFDWFRTPSFGEIHAVEQAALVHLRLYDLQPFQTAHAEMSVLAASFYIERSGLPRLIIFADEATATRYEAAIEAAFRMLTQPLVEFIAESLIRTIRAVRA